MTVRTMFAYRDAIVKHYTGRSFHQGLDIDITCMKYRVSGLYVTFDFCGAIVTARRLHRDWTVSSKMPVSVDIGRMFFGRIPT